VNVCSPTSPDVRAIRADGERDMCEKPDRIVILPNLTRMLNEIGGFVER